MRVWLGLLGAAISCAVIIPPAAADDGGDRGNPVIGRAIFVRDNCSTCHGGRAGGGFGPNLRDDRPDDDEIRDAVLNGRPHGMPPYRGLLNDAEVGHLVAYIRSLRRDIEPVFTHWWEVIANRPSRCC